VGGDLSHPHRPREVDSPFEPPVAALAHHHPHPRFNRRPDPGDQERLAVHGELEVVELNAGNLAADLPGIADVEEIRNRDCLLVTVDAPSQGFDVSPNLDELCEVSMQPTHSEFPQRPVEGVARGLGFVEGCCISGAIVHGRESSTASAGPRYRSNVIRGRVAVLAGPTASGKSAAALQLALAHPELGIEVISADALQGYRGFDIGTAKPSAAERAAVPHHLIDFREPMERLDVATWTLAAEEIIAEVFARGGEPLVVAGTGFYLDALERGLPTTPRAEPELRAELEVELARRGLEPLLQELQSAAPADAQASQRNPRRVLRALEVLRATGKPPSAYPRRPARFRLHTLVALPSTEVLAARSGERLQSMVAAGWLQEVEGLLTRVPMGAPAWQAIGYRELAAVVRQELPLAEALAAIALATSQYAKRQRTWFARHPTEAERSATPFAGRQALIERWFRVGLRSRHTD